MGTASSSGRTLKNSGRVLMVIGTGILFVLGFVPPKWVLLVDVLALALIVAGAFLFLILNSRLIIPYYCNLSPPLIKLSGSRCAELSML
jgi:hypothetical protein